MGHYTTAPLNGASTAGEEGSKLLEEVGNLHREVGMPRPRGKEQLAKLLLIDCELLAPSRG
jgi:hypothetical protein